MQETGKSNIEARRYLLGDLRDEEKIRLEEAFFADDSQFDELELIEDEIIDGYVRDELSPAERQQFLAKLRSSPRLVERVHFATALAEKATSRLAQEAGTAVPATFPVSNSVPEAKVRWWEVFVSRPLQLAFVVVLLVGSLAVATAWLRLRSEAKRIELERAALQQQNEELNQQSARQKTIADQLSAELQRERDARAEDQKLIERLQRSEKPAESTQPTFVATVASIFLMPGSLRSGGDARVLILRNRKAAELKLALERNDYVSYRVSVTNGNGAEVFSTKLSKARKTRSGDVLIISIPGDRLPPNDYTVTVLGNTASGQVESVDDYDFRVVK